MRSPCRSLVGPRLALTLLAGSALLGQATLANASSASNQASPQPNTPRLACNESVRSVFASDADTEVLLVRGFRNGEPLSLADTPAADTPKASADVCVVKLLVGPGNPGPADAPSTSAGIGIEIWLPSPKQWNERLHIKGGGGWVGGVQASTTALAGIANSSSGSVAFIFFPAAHPG